MRYRENDAVGVMRLFFLFLARNGCTPYTKAREHIQSVWQTGDICVKCCHICISFICKSFIYLFIYLFILRSIDSDYTLGGSIPSLSAIPKSNHLQPKLQSRPTLTHQMSISTQEYTVVPKRGVCV